MANATLALSRNSPGPIFVDRTCIDCETCFHLAPSVFQEAEGQSVVVHQPDTSEEWEATKRALISCPTSSIGLRTPSQAFARAPVHLPLLIEDNVSYCGYTSRNSFGASSYLIKRAEGNILIDSPRFNAQLVRSLEDLGGVALMILTHKDDVADHELFAEHFKLDRVIHEAELNPGTAHCEIILREGFDENFLTDLKIIEVPGHTRGHVCVLYKDRFLFTGDHLFVEGEALSSSRDFNWYSWSEQIRSTEKLFRYTFDYVLPGHGGWGRFPATLKDLALTRLLQTMREDS